MPGALQPVGARKTRSIACVSVVVVVVVVMVVVLVESVWREASNFGSAGASHLSHF